MVSEGQVKSIDALGRDLDHVSHRVRLFSCLIEILVLGDHGLE